MQRRDLRTLAPAIQPRSSPDPEPPRRKRTSIACHPCRERRSACDGLRPTCSSCGMRMLVCSYANSEDMEMRPTVLRNQIAALREKVAAYEAFLECLRTLPQETVQDVVQCLRAGSGVTMLLDALRGGRLAELVSTPQEAMAASLSPDEEFGLHMPAFNMLGLAADLEASAAGRGAGTYSHDDLFLTGSLPFMSSAVSLSTAQETVFSDGSCQGSPSYNLSTTRQLSCDFSNEYIDAKRDSDDIMAAGHAFPLGR